MGIDTIELWDGDIVELHNLSNQYFRRDDLGKNKAQVASSLVSELNPDREKLYIDVHPEFYNGEELSGKIVFVCTDNIESRRIVYSAWKKSIFNEYYIDARMGGELFHIYSLSKHSSMKDLELYETKHLSHGNVDLPCTARTIIYNINVISGLVGDIVKKMCNGESFPFHITGHLKTLDFIVSKE